MKLYIWPMALAVVFSWALWECWHAGYRHGSKDAWALVERMLKTSIFPPDRAPTFPPDGYMIVTSRVEELDHAQCGCVACSGRLQ